MMEYFTLNNGAGIPAIGIGTFLLPPADAERSVAAALADGYELIDTANAYMNEKAVGRGILRSGRKRESVYLSTKLWPSVYADADRAIDATLARLQTSYVDLLFLHQPVGDCAGAWRAMERAVKSGKVRSLGLSNFSGEQITALARTAEIPPAVIQAEAHPYFPQTELKACLRILGARIMAWYPIGHGDSGLLREPALKQLSGKYGKSTAQIILRWHIQSGNIVIPGSKNTAHIQENIRIFDFRLSPEDMETIAALDKGVRYYTATKEALESYLAFAPDFDSQK